MLCRSQVIVPKDWACTSSLPSGTATACVVTNINACSIWIYHWQVNNKENWDDGKIEFVEQFKAMFTNRANKVLGILNVSTGGVIGTVADPRVIFAAAIKSGATGLIVAHNHPSGNLIASQSDIELTKRLREAGKVLEIQLLDHIILTTEGYFSFADEGLI